MLYRVVRIIGVGRGFPPPAGHDTWSAEAVKEVAHEFLVHRRTPKRLAWLMVHTSDDASMQRAFLRIVHNYLRDVGRTTEVGRLVVRIDTVLADSEYFARQDGRWALSDASRAASAVPPRELRVAAESVEEVTVPRWSDTARRSQPHADAASIRRLCRAVLLAAAGSLDTATLAQAMAPRLGLGDTPIAETLDVPEPIDPSYGAAIEASAELDAARALFERLTDMEKKIMATAHLPLRDVYDVIGLRKSQAGEVRARTISLVKAMTSELLNPNAVRLHLLDIAQTWLERTRSEGMTS
jgi:hypothetical protein